MSFSSLRAPSVKSWEYKSWYITSRAAKEQGTGGSHCSPFQLSPSQMLSFRMGFQELIPGLLSRGFPEAEPYILKIIFKTLP
jgi:hypothetical protein